MTNLSLNYSHWWTSNNYITASVQLFQGIAITLPNILLLSTILYHQNLKERKEYMVIFGVALADGLAGLGTSSVGTVSLYYYMSGLAGFAFTIHQCLTSISVNVIIYGMSAQGWILVAQSVDRLLLVLLPLQYYSFSTRYVWGLISVVFCYCALQSMALVYVSWGDATVFSGMICIPHSALAPVAFKFWNSIHLASACLSVMIYGFVMVFYRYKSNKVAPGGTGNAMKEYQKRQRKVTISMSISCLFTFLFFVLPRLFNVLLIKFAAPGNIIMTARHVAFSLYNVNPALNLFIYIKRHKELRLGLIYLFKLKDLPPLESLGTRVGQ